MAEPPTKAAVGDVPPFFLMMPWTSPTPWNSAGMKAPMMPPIVAPNGPPARKPMPAPAAPPAKLGAINGNCSPKVSLTQAPNSPAESMSTNSVLRVYSAASRSFSSRPFMAQRRKVSAPVASLAASMVPKKCAWVRSAPRNMARYELAPPGWTRPVRGRMGAGMRWYPSGSSAVGIKRSNLESKARPSRSINRVG